MLEIAHPELAEGAVDRLAIAQAGVVGFGQRPPVSVIAKNGQHMIVVAHRLEIQQQGRVAEHAQRGRAEERAFHAMRRAVAQHAARRTAGLAIALFVIG